MIQALYSGVSGLVNQQTRLDTIGSNIANANTIGYKSVRLDFKDAMYQTMRRPVQPKDAVDQQLGHGVNAAATTQLLGQGYMDVTNRDLDFALEGEGYFAVEVAPGEIEYTRGGNFYLSVEADGNYLVSGEGQYVLDDAYRRIRVPQAGLSCDGQGNLYDGPTQVGKLGVYAFENNEGLTRQGGNRFAVSENSGAARLVQVPKVVQGSVEMSNVDMSSEMTLMIRAQRAFQFAGDVVRTADTMWATVNGMRR